MECSTTERISYCGFAFEALGLIVQIIFAIIGWIIQRIFFWTIDIVPHDGADAAEAKSVVTHGKIIRLAKKLSRDIEHWTYEDTDEFVTLFNWRARWFFNTVERYRIRVRILKRHFEETGRQPADLDAAEVKSLVGHLDVGWGEWLITTPYTFKSIVAAVTILVALVAINSK